MDREYTTHKIPNRLTQQTDHAYHATTCLVVHRDRATASSGDWTTGPAFGTRPFVEPPLITEVGG